MANKPEIIQTGGRPCAVIDEDQFVAMCKIQCTQEEICAVLNVDDKTLTRWCKDNFKASFSEIYKQKRQGGRSSLRRMQWQNAEGGNVTMQIFLGKNYLGQSDKPEEVHVAARSEPIEIIDDIKPEDRLV